MGPGVGPRAYARQRSRATGRRAQPSPSHRAPRNRRLGLEHPRDKAGSHLGPTWIPPASRRSPARNVLSLPVVSL
jgi:hypothetical protein